jgi:hypothetical protein
MLSRAKNGWFRTSTPAAATHGLVVKSVQAGMPSSSPSRASTSAPEHWAAISCRDGSRRRSSRMIIRSSVTSRVAMPLPTITASAPHASSRVDICSMTTPFIEVTFAVGVAIVTRQPSPLTRLSTPSAISESSSL